jgi:scyllo-inositol 2-dehydrogenase (NADP+)
MGKIKVAFIGAGNIITSRHIATFKASGRVEIIGIIDTNQPKLESICRKAGIPRHSADMEAEWFKDVDAVCIGTPPFAHYRTAREALSRGKHVLLEKPMCLEIGEAEELVELAKKKGLVFCIVHNFQFASSAVRLKEMVDKGDLGRIRNILGFQVTNDSRRLPKWHEQIPFGLLYDEAPHLSYLLKTFGGELELSSARYVPSSIGKVTPAIVTADIKSDRCPCSLYINFESPVCEWQLMVFGEKALGIVDIFRDILIVLPNDGPHLAFQVMRTSLVGTWMHYMGVARSAVKRLSGKLFYGNDEVVRRFLNAIETGAEPIGIRGEDGLAVLKTQHELIAKLKTQ